MKLLPALLASLLLTPLPLRAENQITLAADTTAPAAPLLHFWSTCVGAGRANEGLRASWCEQLQFVHDQCGFQYVRFHGLYHDDMFVYHLDHSQPVYNFQYIDDLFDRLLAAHVRPFVEFSFNPIDPLQPEPAISTTSPAHPTTQPAWNGQFWWRANGTPPSDNSKWAQLISHTLHHWIARYGIDEVRRWYFEVWNEPNLNGFFHGGSKEKYFSLYQTTALAIKKIDLQLRIGGPATSAFHANKKSLTTTQPNGPSLEDVESLDWQPVWIEDFLRFCSDNHIPVDFISTHPYPQDFPIDDGAGHVSRIKRSINATHHDLALLRDIVNHSPFPHAQIQLTEWSSSPSPRDFTHDALPAAAFIVKTNLDSIGLVDSLSYWTFTDVFEEKGAGDTLFHGGFGLLNYQAIPKPAFHAYRFLNQLGDQLLARTDGAIITRDSATKKIIALAYLYPAEVKISLPVSPTLADAESMLNQGAPVTLHLSLSHLSPSAAFELETLNRDHGNALAAWHAMGSPSEPTREQTAALKFQALATSHETIQADGDGRLDLSRRITPWSLLLLKQK